MGNSFYYTNYTVFYIVSLYLTSPTAAGMYIAKIFLFSSLCKLPSPSSALATLLSVLKAFPLSCTQKNLPVFGRSVIMVVNGNLFIIDVGVRSINPAGNAEWNCCFNASCIMVKEVKRRWPLTRRWIFSPLGETLRMTYLFSCLGYLSPTTLSINAVSTSNMV